MSFILVYSRPWYRKISDNLQKITGGNFTSIEHKKDLILDNLLILNPKYIFFPHWSHIIPEKIYNNFNCVIFHMTDLPYGRGGSPLQNLIVRGHSKTMISAIKCVRELDAGPVYLKKSLSLEGSAKSIFNRATDVVEKMIAEIIEKRPEAVPQKGKIVVFKRRRPEEGNLKNLRSLGKMYDYIRMLDAPGYPRAFLETENIKLEFDRAKYEEGKLKARLKVIKNVESDKDR